MLKKNEISFNLGLINDKEMKRLNKTYRGLSKASNIITFSINEKVNNKFLAGEIIIDLDEAKREAQSLQITLKNELLRLIEHGARNLIREMNV